MFIGAYMNSRMSQEMICIPEYGIMNDFCYAFSKKVLEKLKLLVAEKRLFAEPMEEVKRNDLRNIDSKLTIIGSLVCTQLKNQMGLRIDSVKTEKSNAIDELIKGVEEFLAIFEKK
jgi:hypothetical protein